jgi:peptide deformylase
MKIEINLGAQSGVAKPIKSVKKWITANSEFIDAFTTFAKESGSLSLSANQLLVDGKVCDYRVCTIEVDGGYEVWFNPKMTDAKGQPMPNIETCLTHGFENIVVADRVPGLKVEFTNIDGKKVKNTYLKDDGNTCYAVQHTLDHLDGIPEITMPLPQDIDDTVVRREDVLVAEATVDKTVHKNKRKRERKKRKR